MCQAVSSINVAVVGAGLSGCVTGKALKSRNVRFTIFEKKDNVGGLWIGNYPGAKVQATKSQYEFPEKRFPDLVSINPSAQDVVQYLHEYCTEYELIPHVKFQTEVESIDRNRQGWTVNTVHRSHSGEVTKREELFSHVVICNGLCSNKPFRPPFNGMESFKGKVCHSSEWSDSSSMFKDKNVVVVGSGKSGIDACVAARRYARKVYQVSRTPSAIVPLKLFHLVPYKYVFHTRAAGLLLPAYYSSRPLARALHKMFSPLKWMIWRGIEALISMQLRLPSEMRLTDRLERAAFGASVSVLPRDVVRIYQHREIEVKKSGIERIQEDSVCLKSGEVLDADVIVLATGWRVSMSILPESVVQNLDIASDGLHLYKNVLCPKEPRLALVGSNSLSFQNPLTQSLQAAWLASHICGSRNLPSSDEMIQETERVKNYKRKYYPRSSNRGAIIQAHVEDYNDDLVRDMGYSPRQYSGVVGFLRNWFWPVEAADFKAFVEPRCISTEPPERARKLS